MVRTVVKSCARLTLLLGLMAPFAALSSHTAFAQKSLAEFYQKSNFKIVVGSGAGGGYDTYARVLARHINKHIPGTPTIIVQNMPGASGMAAQNWAYNVAPKDGSVILATYSALIEANLLGNTKAQFEVRKFNWVGSIADSPNVCITWHTSAYKDIRQLIGKEVTAPATGATGKSATMPLLINELLGTKIKVITGYKTNETTLALERGEVDIICGLGYYTLFAQSADWINNKKINFVAQTGLKPVEALKGVPNLLDITTGKDRELLEYIAILEEMGRPYVAPPGMPADKVDAIRAAFDATMADPEFKAELDKLNLNLGAVSGKRMHELIDKMYSYSQDIIDRVARINGVKK